MSCISQHAIALGLIVPLSSQYYMIVDILEINMLIKVVYNDKNWIIVVLIKVVFFFDSVIVLQVYHIQRG